MSEEFNEQDDLEYNDGLGDLLKEKDRLQFSWAKTSTVLVAILAVTVFVFWGIFKLASPSTADIPLNEIEISEELSDEPMKVVEEKTIEETVPEVQIKKETVKPKEIEVAQKPHPKPVSYSKPSYFRVFAGNYSDKVNADELVDILRANKIDTFIWENKKNGTTMYIVQTGSFKKRAAAESLVAKIKSKGIDAYISAKN